MKENLKEAFRTFPLANAAKREKGSNVAIPSEQDVEDAKEWVDFKEMQKKTWSLDQVFFMQFDILKQSFAIGYINV